MSVRRDLEVVSSAAFIFESEARGVLVTSDRGDSVVKICWNIGAGAIGTLQLRALSFEAVVDTGLDTVGVTLASGHVWWGRGGESCEAENGNDGELHVDGW